MSAIVTDACTGSPKSQWVYGRQLLYIAWHPLHVKGVWHAVEVRVPSQMCTLWWLAHASHQSDVLQRNIGAKSDQIWKNTKAKTNQDRETGK